MTTVERYLSRTEAAEFLSERGYKTAPATLAKRAVVGGGPPFVSWGRKPLYQPETLLEWAQRRCTGPRRSTSDRGEERQHDDRLGDPELANSRDLVSNVEELSAGMSRQDPKQDDRHPHPPWAGKATPIDSKHHRARNTFGKKSSAHHHDKGAA